MLVAEHDVEFQDLLAVCHESKVARFNDARVHRAHRYFVHLFARQRSELVCRAINRRGLATWWQVVRRMTTQRPRVRMAYRLHAALLAEFPLEPVRLRHVGRQ
jgi:hypothetical protein